MIMTSMWHLLEAHRYEPRLLSIPFALALATLLVVVVYGLVMRGAPVLRTTMLIWAAALVPYNAACVLASATREPEIAEAWYHIGIAFVPLAASASMSFQLAVAGLFRKRWWWIALAFLTAIPWLYDGIARDDLVRGVHEIRGGILFFSPGPLLIPGLLYVLVVSSAGFTSLLAVTRGEHEPLRRRQIHAT